MLENDEEIVKLVIKRYMSFMDSNGFLVISECENAKIRTTRTLEEAINF